MMVKFMHNGNVDGWYSSNNDELNYEWISSIVNEDIHYLDWNSFMNNDPTSWHIRWNIFLSFITNCQAFIRCL
jgi:hypothetical protein